MANYFPDASLVEELQDLITNKYAGASLCAFISNITPAHGDVAATYTAQEATFGGYARITLSSWGAAYVNASLEAQADEVVRTWTATGTSLPQTIYGIFILSAAGHLLYVESNPTGGVTLSAAGHTFPYTAKRTHKRG